MPDVVVVGAGPAGLTLAHELRTLGVDDVVVLDRDDGAGGVPRYSNHQGYGLRDLRLALSGPVYARLLADRAVAAGADVRLRTTVTAVTQASDRLAVEVTSPSGRAVLDAQAVVLATGCRERPRSARLVAGSRPAGIYTTGWLQRAVYLAGQVPGTRAVVVGAEHVSYSAVMTLAHAGCRTVAMVTDKPAHTSYRAFDAGARARYRFPLMRRASITDIIGAGRVRAVEVLDHSTGATHVVECDTVVFTGDWIGENELARRLGVRMSPAATGPLVDGGYRTSTPGVFAIGNLLHPATTADRCALDGRRAAAQVAARVAGTDATWPTDAVSITIDPPAEWVVPTLVTTASEGPLLVSVRRPLTRPRLTANQGDRELWSARVPWAVPTRPFAIPGDWRADVDPQGSDVRITIT